jgi:hypothetical protein
MSMCDWCTYIKHSQDIIGDRVWVYVMRRCIYGMHGNITRLRCGDRIAFKQNRLDAKAYDAYTCCRSGTAHLHTIMSRHMLTQPFVYREIHRKTTTRCRRGVAYNTGITHALVNRNGFTCSHLSTAPSALNTSYTYAVKFSAMYSMYILPSFPVIQCAYACTSPFANSIRLTCVYATNTCMYSNISSNKCCQYSRQAFACSLASWASCSCFLTRFVDNSCLMNDTTL